MRFLIVNAYPREGRAALDRAAATQPDILYRRLLAAFVPDVACDVLYPADADAALPLGAALSGYAGIIWTGSSLTIHAAGDERVDRQIAFVRAAFEARVPSFGSCWAAQIAVTAAGGRCAANPKGREFGITAPIRLTAQGSHHPLFRGRKQPFRSLTSHADEVVELPPRAVLLASNEFSTVQAVAVEHAGGDFWAVQYHPEYDLREVARLCVLRAEELIRQGAFADLVAAETYIAELERLHAGQGDADLRRRHRVDELDLGISARGVELRNWLGQAVGLRGLDGPAW